MRHLVLLFVWPIFFAFTTNAQNIKVTLLGTGVPYPSIERFGAATLVEANGQFFLFDCGRGATQRLLQQKVQLGKVNKLFLTHLHSDHVVGIPDLWLTGGLAMNFARRTAPLEVWGPNGTIQMTEGLKIAYSWDIQIRKRESGNSDTSASLVGHNINEGIVYNQDGIKITALLVRHSDLIDSALGYRIDYNGRSVVLSGDTRYSENVIKNSKNVDLLVHELAYAGEEAMRNPMVKKIISYHTTPLEAGKIFSLTNPKLAVFSHIALPEIAAGLRAVNAEEILSLVRKQYSGRVEMGEDLMTIEVGESINIKKQRE